MRWGRKLADYLTRTPGVIFNAAIPGLSTVSIRGVSSTNAIESGPRHDRLFHQRRAADRSVFLVAVPDIDAIRRRQHHHPARSAGNIVWFGVAGWCDQLIQAAKPNLREFQGRVQATFSGTEHGGIGGGAKAMLNVPVVTEQLAVRGVYVFRQDAGFIDNLGTGRSDANTTRTRGGRIYVTWNADRHDTRRLYVPAADAGDGRHRLPGTDSRWSVTEADKSFRSREIRTTIHNLRLDQDLGFATLTATATYHTKRQYTDSDVGPLLAAFAGQSVERPIHGLQWAKSQGSTAEVRLASPSGQRFEYSSASCATTRANSLTMRFRPQMRLA